MNVKENQIQIVISRKTIVKIVAVSYLTFSFMRTLDRVMGRQLGPPVDRLTGRIRESTDAQKGEWAEAVKAE